MKMVIGIDPGKQGGLALVGPAGVCHQVLKMPETERDVYDTLARWTSQWLVCGMIEKVHAMPKQGVSSSFAFGRNYGFLRGCLVSLRIRFDEVTPQAWQRKLGCLTGGDKNISKGKAQQLYPDIKMTHSIADALLIAHYGHQHHFKD